MFSTGGKRRRPGNEGKGSHPQPRISSLSYRAVIICYLGPPWHQAQGYERQVTSGGNHAPLLQTPPSFWSGAAPLCLNLGEYYTRFLSKHERRDEKKRCLIIRSNQGGGVLCTQIWARALASDWHSPSPLSLKGLISRQRVKAAEIGEVAPSLPHLRTEGAAMGLYRSSVTNANQHLCLLPNTGGGQLDEMANNGTKGFTCTSCARQAQTMRTHLAGLLQ